MKQSRESSPPSNLELIVVQFDLAHESIRVESGSRRRVKERDESATFFGQDLDVLDRSKAHLTQKFVDRGVRGQVADVDSPPLQGSEAS